jgi:hypothetical protein
MTGTLHVADPPSLVFWLWIPNAMFL